MYETRIEVLELDGSGEAYELIQKLKTEGWDFSHPLINDELAAERKYHCVFKRPKQ